MKHFLFKKVKNYQCSSAFRYKIGEILKIRERSNPHRGLRCQQDLVQWTINQQLRRTSTILREKNLPSVLIDHYTIKQLDPINFKAHVLHKKRLKSIIFNLFNCY